MTQPFLIARPVPCPFQCDDTPMTPLARTEAAEYPHFQCPHCGFVFYIDDDGGLELCAFPQAHIDRALPGDDRSAA